MTTITPQEIFWAGEFGDEYSSRNTGNGILAAKSVLFGRILSRTDRIRSVRELGANIGLNMRAIRSLLPEVELQAIEINPVACSRLRDIPGVTVHEGSIFDEVDWPAVDMSFTAGVLIHINPDMLPIAYDKLHSATNRYLMVAEYYNPVPVSIRYRDHEDRLFKRDFAGEILERHSDLRLIDYGFVYRRDANFPLDDLTWFLMEKV